MPTAWFDGTLAWITAHPRAAGGLILLIAFCDALAVVGIIVPALPLLFAVGVLIGLGHIDGPYAVACTAAGAFAGDALSYWIGHRWGPTMRGHWPFRRYPQLLDRGERVFRRHGSSGLVIARFVGAVRPFVPAIAGMLGMPLRRYVPVSLFAAFAWAVAFLGPGWLFGKSYDAVAAVADRLALVLCALAIAVALAWSVVLYTWRWFAGHADRLLASALRWTRAHPRLGRYAGALIDPNRPESASLLMLAACLFLIAWAWFALLAVLWTRGGPLLLDHSVRDAMAALRNPLADRLMAALATLGDPSVLGPAAIAVLLWLAWRRRFVAAAHWLAALAFGFALTGGLRALLPAHAASFGVPSLEVTMATITFGFFAVLIARELPGRDRAWPYLVGGAIVTLLGFSELYLGAHWLSDVLGGALFGIVWLLVLGIAYRRHVARSFWMRPIALGFYGVFAIAALWHAPRSIEITLARYAPAAPARTLDLDPWWSNEWTRLPAQRNETIASARDATPRWDLDLQYAGSVAALQRQLAAKGWRVQPQAGWVATLSLLDDDRPPSHHPVLPATLEGRPESLLLLRDTGPQDAIALRLWLAPQQFRAGPPLWIGTTQRLRHGSAMRVASLWRPLPDDGLAHARLRQDLAGWTQAEAPHPDTARNVLRVRER
ncbi:membrane protein [Lysobacter helvus]|uniref:Membrane protein n=2 Tax=Lysobacteraceae TaxID=32033 RepID=A0ABM7Q5V1_9GAMM|nr:MULTISPECIES: bifunctional DedA family/phosphatase PAP2 family protein [Lysobacter]BCT92671.1 membrane protein [Lysobacter caseinilyticus]BCT95824.1 membrane protein [Lysobacter helvus]